MQNYTAINELNTTDYTNKFIESLFKNSQIESQSKNRYDVPSAATQATTCQTRQIKDTKDHFTNIVDVYKKASEDTGGYIKLLDEYSYCPILIGNDNASIPLYEFIEVIDEIIDYDKLQENYPNLSYSQIYGAISFIRKVAQFNTKNIDIDERIDEEEFINDKFIEKLKESYSKEKIIRVLNLD